METLNSLCNFSVNPKLFQNKEVIKIFLRNKETSFNKTISVSQPGNKCKLNKSG